MKREKKTGEIVAVCVSDRKGVRKKDIGRTFLKAGWGIEADAHSGDWHRQISLLAVESMEKLAATMSDSIPDLDRPSFQPGDFAENLTTRGIELYTMPIGTRLRIGDKIELEVTQIGKECHLGCAIRDLVGDCIMPREGIFGRVLAGGEIKAGDRIKAEAG
ncbi:MAG: MOSC domain-containing protein [Candidatus Auribacterota bacterium]|nr:MOSC domain-containing protein [Candidatus Auribacterota bacterium]